MKKVLFSILTSFSLVGCCSIKASGDRYNLDYVKPGMTRDQVVEIMRDPVDCVKVEEEEVMMYNGACISLVDNKVIEKTALEADDATRFQLKLHDSTAPVDELVDEIYDSADRKPASEKPIEVPMK